MDVTLVRMQADSMKPKDMRRGYKNVFDALFRVIKEEGFLNLYSGLFPNVLRGMSINVGMLACYDQAKEFIGHKIFKDPKNGPTPLKTQLAASLVAGFTASVFSLPFDLLKSRLRKFTVSTFLVFVIKGRSTFKRTI
jgi:solute carrier family 25 (mitochondrial oxoglutarate transporter), member 11